jgi:hypothetical protein
VFEASKNEALTAFDRIIGLDLSVRCTARHSAPITMATHDMLTLSAVTSHRPGLEEANGG